MFIANKQSHREYIEKEWDNMVSPLLPANEHEENKE